MGDSVLSGNSESKRQAGAQQGQLGQVGRVIVAAPGPGDTAQQHDSIRFLKDVEPDTLRGVADRQAGELIPARDDHEWSGTRPGSGAVPG